MTKIKANAAAVAAPIAHDNSAMAALAGAYTDKATKFVGQLQLEYAQKARAVLAADSAADVTPLAKAFGKQRKSELLAIVAATDSDLEEALELPKGRAKPGLQQVARALKLVQFGPVADATAAQTYISKGLKADWLAATGQESDEKTMPPAIAGPLASAGDEDNDAQQRVVTTPVPAREEVGNLKRVLDLLPALEAEMSKYDAKTRKATAAAVRAMQTLADLAANG